MSNDVKNDLVARARGNFIPEKTEALGEEYGNTLYRSGK